MAIGDGMKPRKFDKERSRGTRIQSAARGSQLLRWLAERPGGAVAKEVAFGNRLPLATTYHILNTLVEEGMLAKDSRRHYVLGGGAAVLARAYQEEAAPPAGMFEALRALSERTSGSASLAEWSDSEIRVLASADSGYLLRIADLAGQPFGAGHARANGKLLLAYAPPGTRDAYLTRHPLRRLTGATTCDAAAFELELAQIREQGYACDQREYDHKLSCVSAPLLRDGEIVAAYGVSVAAETFAARRDELTTAVLDATSGYAIARPPLRSKAAPLA